MANQRALISVSNKVGLIDFAKTLQNLNIEVISTGGTAKFLSEAGILVTKIKDYTQFPELFGGRVKTLHPNVHGGLLYRREESVHCEQAKEHGIAPIDFLIVNLYPFEETVSQSGVSLEEAIEQIDIGGPAMLRSGAKNYQSVTVIVDPLDYAGVESELKEKGATSLELRAQLASKAFLKTSTYDHTITQYLGENRDSQQQYNLTFSRKKELRYGDNPHQKATLYGQFDDFFTQLNGKELSYTNVLDIEAAAELISDFERLTLAILKHTNPCGIGQDSESLLVAWQKAFDTDQQATFGGVIVCNRPVTSELAQRVSAIFMDMIIAPKFEEDALKIFRKKKNLRLIEIKESYALERRKPVFRSAPGGIMVMDRDNKIQGIDNPLAQVVTHRKPTQEELEALDFAWRVVKHIKSNAMVFAKAGKTLGIGAGQMSRVDSSRLAIWKAQQANLSLEGSVLASDALLPFADGLESAIEAGATACIQPGGSIRDEEVIVAANAANMAMVFTGHRHFWH